MTSPFALTPAQIACFETFGYLGFPGLLRDRIEEITAEFEALWAARSGGHDGQPHTGESRSCVVPFIDQRPRLAALLDDERVHGIAKSLLGDDFNYMGSDGNFYVGDTPWHSDGWHEGLRHLKIAFYLDPLTRESGALRVIPGSHRIDDPYAQALQRDISRCQELWGIQGSEVPALALETQPGDIVCFNHNIKHASYGGSQRRRMFTINLSQRYPEAQLASLRDYISGGARFWIERAYGDAMVNTAGPARLRHLEQVMANDSHLAELSRQARERMTEPARG